MNWERIAIISGAIAVVASFWQRIQQVIAWVRSWVIVSRRTDFDLAQVLIAYLEANFRRAKSTEPVYGSAMAHVTPIGRIMRVVFSPLWGGTAGQTFWKKGRPLWYGSNENKSSGTRYNFRDDFMCQFQFVRGSFDFEKLLYEATLWESEQQHGRKHRRFAVHHHYGTSLVHVWAKGDSGSPPGSNATIELGGSWAHWDNPAKGFKLLHWDHEDIKEAPVASIDQLSLRPELEDLLRTVKFWKESQPWYQERGIPWRLGILAHGGPGTGKTSFTRGVAELLDMPVHVFDLVGMSNQDLKKAWREMLTTAPCIALLEDIDAVFHGRDNIATKNDSMMGTTGVTFDALLNCIDGIERVDGLLLVVTTNKLDKLDAALVERPGRIDRVVEFVPLDQNGRVKMAMRILGVDNPNVLDQVIAAGEHDSAAQFQDRCCRAALKLRFG